ncbi:hypothetical protein CPB83DRAFT_864301 [Crepidotus variabilis]|uniref:Lysine-specific metallo-endopeptidase domain-containing protein n=1 Tax=Crepidotus variabilis TaxID=179855 RepID=A0A9P6E4X3_9AGAR|nr:hypothetical protein CPB83DRAFT_864301 [Crepidotus variabilis]
MKFCSLFSILVLYATYVLSLPLPLELKVNVKTPDTTKSAFIASVQKEAETLLTKMAEVAADPHGSKPRNELIMEHCFGFDWEEHTSEIKANIDAMKKSVVTITMLSGPPPSSDSERLAQWQPSTKDFRIFDRFYTLGSGAEGVQMSALVIIHELSHAAFGSVDRFTKDFQPARGQGNPDVKYLGYLQRDFREIRNKAGAKAMVMNADSYTLMAHLKVNGMKAMFNGRIPYDKFIIKRTDKRKRSPSPPATEDQVSKMLKKE